MVKDDDFLGYLINNIENSRRDSEKIETHRYFVLHMFRRTHNRLVSMLFRLIRQNVLMASPGH